MKRAILNPNYNGMESGVIVLKKDSGEIIERAGTFYLKAKEELVGGWARVYRKNWEYPIYCSVSFEEVAQKTRDGKLNANWAGKGATMVEKVAKVRAVRETFIDDLGGMYEAEELGVELPSETEAPQENVIIQDEPVEIDEVKVVSMDEI